MTAFAVRETVRGPGPDGPGGLPTKPLPATAGTEATVTDMVEEWGLQSFPASDPPANW
jgi:hypothetical protein